MSQPQSQIILDQVVGWLNEIRIANGYYTDAGDDVRTEQNRDSEPERPCLYLFDDDATWTESGNTGRGIWTQTFTLEGLVFDDGWGRLECRKLIADIHRALRRRPTEWLPTAGVISCTEATRSIPPRPLNSDWLTPSVTFQIEFVDRMN
jgi:hypothetical protein